MRGKEMVIKETKTITTYKEYKLSSEDIEAIIRYRLELPESANFTWNIGQWISLEIVVKTQEVVK